MDDFIEKKPKKHSDAALATAARFSWEVLRCCLCRIQPRYRRVQSYYGARVAQCHVSGLFQKPPDPLIV